MTEQYGMPMGNAVGMITQAIVAANYQEKGVPYGPFLMAAMGPNGAYTIGPSGSYSAYTQSYIGGGFWTSQRGDFPISFYQIDSGYSFDSGFVVLVNGYPLGGVAVPQIPPSSVPAAPYCYYMAPAPGVPAAVVAATDMPWVLDDHGSHNPGDVTYHWPTAPDGFHALGTAFWWDNDTQAHKSGACIAAAFLEQGVNVPFWNDTGQGWSHDGSLSQVQLAPTVTPTAQLRFSPGTLISEEAVRDGNFDCAPRTLVADAPMLPVPGAGPPSPTPIDGSTVTAVTVLPGLTVTPAGQHGAFCYLGAVVSWEMVFGPAWPTEYGRAPDDPTFPLTIPVGMDGPTAARLKSDIGAECGARHGLLIPPTANGYVSIDLSAILGIVAVPGAPADGYPLTVHIEDVSKPITVSTPEIEVRQQVIDLVLFDVAGQPIGQPYRFSTPNIARQQMLPFCARR